MNLSILDSLTEIKKIDRGQTLESVAALADQVRHAWQDVQNIKFELNHQIDRVVVAGMGGSALGPDIIKHLYFDQLTVPLEVINGYHLPNYVDQNTLVILSSYSGSTEETLNCEQEASQKKAPVLVISAGGKLVEIAKQKKYPLYLIKPQYNPSKQPRMAIGYAVIGMIGLLKTAQIIKISDQEIQDVIITVLKISEDCQVQQKTNKNPAKTLAFTLFDKKPIFVASEFLTGAVHTCCNIFNENAKIFADFKIIPEINHHLMEALKYPNSNRDSIFFIFFASQIYFPRNQKRLTLTQQVVEKCQIENTQIQLKTESKLTQVFELITLMNYTAFYLSILEKVNAVEIPYVDWFKKQLAV